MSTRRTPATKPEPVAAGRPGPTPPTSGRISPAGALERCVGDVDVFAARHWGRAPLHRSGAGPWSDVLTLDDVDTIVRSALRRPQIRLVRDGERLDDREYCTDLRLGGRHVEDAADPAKVSAAFSAGATVVLQSLHRTWPPLARFAADLEHAASHPVQANAYLTPPGSRGLAPHRDGHDVLVLQLHGTKRWTVEGLGQPEVPTGDVLYLPAGTLHSATTGDHASLHVTIGILRTTYRAVLERLVAADGSLDRPLPLGYAAAPADELEAGLAVALDAVRALVDGVDVAEVARREQRRRRPRTQHDGRLASAARLPELGPSSVVRLRRGLVPHLERDGHGEVRLELDDRALHLPAVAVPALQALCGGGDVAVSDLPGVDPASRLVLARRLVAEGMLTIVPDADGLPWLPA